MIHRIDDMDGTLFLSERRARALKTWEKVIEAHERDEVIEAPSRRSSRAACWSTSACAASFPHRRSAASRSATSTNSSASTLRLKVIDLDHKRHRVVLSQRLVLEEELKAKKQELLGTLEVGQIREGVVVRLADFGAFVDLGGIDGLIHNSELSTPASSIRPKS